jgi:hypothetical protein
MGIWHGVANGLPKLIQGPPCLTLLSLAGRPPLKQPYGRAERAACGRLLPLWTPHSVRPLLIKCSRLKERNWFLSLPIDRSIFLSNDFPMNPVTISDVREPMESTMLSRVFILRPRMSWGTPAIHVPYCKVSLDPAMPLNSMPCG